MASNTPSNSALSTTTNPPSSSSSSPTKAPLPLTELSPNTTSPTKPSHSSPPKSSTTTTNENANPHPYQQPGKQDQQTYISPSDTIMSPTTKKLSAIKGRRFAGAGKPQEGMQKSLFARTVGRQQALRDGGGNVAGKGTEVGGEVGKGGD